MSLNMSLILGHPRSDSFCHAIAATAITTLRTNGHVVAFHDLYAEGFHPLVTAEESRTRVSDDPLVEQHCTELTRAEGLIVVHPNWWGYPPAILKGWIDRVIRPGVAYELAVEESGARTLHVGRLYVRTAFVFNTSDTPLGDFRKSFYRLVCLLALPLRCRCGDITVLCALRSVLIRSQHPARYWVNSLPENALEQEQTRFGDTLGSLWKHYIAPLSGIPDLHRHVFSVMATSTPAMRAAWLEDVRTMIHHAFPATPPV